MPEISSRADPSAVADCSPDPAVNTTPTPIREEKRLSSLQFWEEKQFAVSLKTNAQRMKQFLHDGK